VTSNDDPHDLQVQDDEPEELEYEIPSEEIGRLCRNRRISLLIISLYFIAGRCHWYRFLNYSGIIHQNGLHLAL
jgi:hypothetical protein